MGRGLMADRGRKAVYRTPGPFESEVFSVVAVESYEEGLKSPEYAAHVYLGDNVVFEHRSEQALYPGGIRDFASHTMDIFAAGLRACLAREANGASTPSGDMMPTRLGDLMSHSGLL